MVRLGAVYRCQQSFTNQGNMHRVFLWQWDCYRTIGDVGSSLTTASRFRFRREYLSYHCPNARCHGQKWVLRWLVCYVVSRTPNVPQSTAWSTFERSPEGFLNYLTCPHIDLTYAEFFQKVNPPRPAEQQQTSFRYRQNGGTRSKQKDVTSSLRDPSSS